MKREILCTNCKNDLRKLFPNDNPYEGEHIKFVSGTANHTMICDKCETSILQGTLCHAISIWADDHGIPYYPWEQDYLSNSGVENVA